MDFATFKKIQKEELKIVREAIASGKFENFHKQQTLNFNVYNGVFGSISKRKIYKSPSYNGRQGSEYYIGIIKGKLAYIRKSNHWGNFSIRNSSPENPTVEDTSYTWELEGGKKTKEGRYAHTSQIGYIFI